MKGLNPHLALYLIVPKHLALKANRAQMQETHKTVVKKETILNRLVRTCCGSPHRAQHRGSI